MGINGDHVNAQMPLAGVVLCCTSITPELRTEFAQTAQQMGATHKFDLTSDVTHLLVGDIDTPKYKYVAKERPDVKVVLPAWLEAVRQSWMEGGATDVSTFEEQYKVPPLYNLRISITGFDDLPFRQGLSQQIVQQGAEYSGDLTKHITHLLAARPEGKKYTFARQWNVKVVSLKWLHDSVKRGMALEEKLYDPLLPAEEQGKGAWNTMASPATLLGKRARGEIESETRGQKNIRKLRRTASTKLGSQNESIWADITSHSASDRRDSDSMWADVNEGPPTPDTASRPPSRARQDSAPRTVAIIPAEQGTTIQERPRLEDGVFQQRVVYIHGFDKQKASILHTHLQANNANVCRTSTDLDKQAFQALEEGYLVIPDDIPLSQLPAVPEYGERLFKVTNWWVEKCLHYKCLVDPTSDTLCKPFLQTGITDFKGLSITSTGFTGIDLLHVSKAVKLMGATYDEYLKKSTSVLICSPTVSNKEKLKLAADSGIPAVSLDWLLHSVELGNRKPYAEYLVQRLSVPLNSDHVTSKRNRSEARHAVNRPADEHGPTTALPDHRKVPQRTPQDKVKSKAKLSGPLPAQVTTSEAASKSTSQPLEELPSVINSPRRPSNVSNRSSKSTTSTTKSITAPLANEDGDTAQLNSVSPPAAPVPALEPDLTNAIAALLAHKQASRSTSAAPSESAETNRQRRKRGLLGRATSGTGSALSTGEAENSVQNHTTEELSLENYKASREPVHGNQWVESRNDSSVRPDEEHPPQTQLVYENPEARRAREIMLAKMGGAAEEGLPHTKEIGTVRDIGKDICGGVGRAVRRRR